MSGFKVKKIVEVLDRDEMLTIHSASLHILEKVGIQFHHPYAIRVLGEAGCQVDKEGSIVRIPSDLVEEAIKKSPGEVVLCGRNPKHDLTLTKGSVHFKSGAEAPWVIDLEGHFREATLADFIQLTKLNDFLENVHFLLPVAAPQDVPREISETIMAKEAFSNTDKHYMGGPIGKKLVRYHMEMANTIMGSKEALKKRPIVSLVVCNNPPLSWGKEALETVLEGIDNGIPIHPSCETISGATCPITLAGSLVQQNAEILGMLVLIQSLKAGHPFIAGTLPCTMDMRTTNVVLGSVEYGLMSAGMAQLYRDYEIPFCGGGGVADSQFLDEQAALEKTSTLLLTSQAGADIVSLTTGMLGAANVISPVQCVIDNEILGSAGRILAGIEVNEYTLAVEVIESVAHGGHYLRQRHTMDYLQKEHYIPTILQKLTRSGSERGGLKNIVERGKERATEILGSHRTTPLPKDVQRELELIVKKAKEELVT